MGKNSPIKCRIHTLFPMLGLPNLALNKSEKYAYDAPLLKL